MDQTPNASFVAVTHCRSCGANDGETIYTADEGYTQCCNKSLTDECSTWCGHLNDADYARAEERERRQNRGW